MRDVKSFEEAVFLVMEKQQHYKEPNKKDYRSQNNSWRNNSNRNSSWRNNNINNNYARNNRTNKF